MILGPQIYGSSQNLRYAFHLSRYTHDHFWVYQSYARFLIPHTFDNTDSYLIDQSLSSLFCYWKVVLATENLHKRQLGFEGAQFCMQICSCLHDFYTRKAGYWSVFIGVYELWKKCILCAKKLYTLYWKKMKSWYANMCRRIMSWATTDWKWVISWATGTGIHSLFIIEEHRSQLMQRRAVKMVSNGSSPILQILTLLRGH